MSADVHTYTGLWINWSQGKIKGATLTISQQSGGLLAAFLALYVAFAGGMFWRAISFIIHQAKTTKPDDTRDALHHQRQVILRNSGNVATAWALLTFPLQRKLNRRASFLRCLPYALLALFCFLGFGLAGIFSSRISKVAGTLNLVFGPYCGLWNIDPQSEISLSKYLADTYEAANYVRQCYGNDNVSSSSSCRAYVRPSLPYATNANAPCPFGSEICNAPAFQMDTGLLDSHFDFGINAPPRDRVQFRRVATCVPLRRVPSSLANDSQVGQTLLINAGPVPGAGTNYTFLYIIRSQHDMIGYSLSAELHQDIGEPGGDAAQWNPIYPFNRPDAEVTLMMLAQNGVKYTAPVDDPWFSAHEQVNITSRKSVWMSDYAVSLLGCIDQYQLCNPAKPGDSGCTQLSSAEKIQRGGRQPCAFRLQHGQAVNILQILLEHSWDRISWPIPKTQWQHEVSIWFQTCLAKEQSWAVEWATAPRNLQATLAGDGAALNVTPPINDEGRQQCSQQMVHGNGAHQSFSVLGLALTLALGGIIILTGLAIDVVVGRLRPQSTRYKKEQWDVEEVLALHKAAYAGRGLWDDNQDSSRLHPSTILLRQSAAVNDDKGSGSARKTGYSVVEQERDDDKRAR
ncbi:hypothetical protein K469DRAFT_696089 [Zopfia rhizophila CBS 207.26]|uniref:Uncharacterized protein n=1 Tax=Zopfia rhizophila CBS 207.26 TaxID=1314779 RepID=A0A6A6EPL3_9PEZI|nr:hypothetical protein K469DRAFT_696089 [Zopfia rhizophila CBS 207.26]